MNDKKIKKHTIYHIFDAGVSGGKPDTNTVSVYNDASGIDRYYYFGNGQEKGGPSASLIELGQVHTSYVRTVRCVVFYCNYNNFVVLGFYFTNINYTVRTRTNPKFRVYPHTRVRPVVPQ